MKRDQVALVTGGAVRVGGAISRGLAGAGYSVAVNYHTSRIQAEELVEELRADGYDAAAIQADVTDAKQVDRLVERTMDELGTIDLLVNNAAIFHRCDFLEVDHELWSRTLAVNLQGPFLVSQQVALGMWERRRGRIVNICGTIGIRPVGSYVPYCVAKTGLDTLTRGMAQALAPRVQVNGVAPGAVLFPEATTEAQRRDVVERVPSGRAGDPADVVAAVLFFAQAPTYITGAILPVDGGASVVGG